MADDDRIDDETVEPEEEPDETGQQADEAADEPEPEPTAEEPQFGPEAPPEDTDVFDMLRAAIGLFSQEAWIALGVQARYGSADTETDLNCARVAIDTTQVLVEKLGDEADEAEKREYEQLLTNLRVNFVRRQSKEEGEE
jgi:hypothetical protein